MRYLLPIVLYAVGMTAVAIVVAVQLALQHDEVVTKPEPHWIYGPRTGPAKTGQKGVVVTCQEKTNSMAFAERKYASPGDVYVLTCRAVKEGR